MGRSEDLRNSRPRILVLPQILNTDSRSPGRLSAIPNQEFALIPGECLKRLWQKGCEVSVFMLPSSPAQEFRHLLPEFDGLLLIGGEDVDPIEWGGPGRQGGTNPARDRVEIDVLRSAVESRIPVLGICRGCQVVNVAMGGTLVPDLDLGVTNGNHRNSDGGALVRHQIKMDDDWSETTEWPRNFDVSSVHHQAVDQVAEGLRPIAWAPDGTIEAVAGTGIPVLGVQWHPEFMDSSEPGAIEPFLWLARETLGRRA